MRFALDKPVKIVLLGAGGTGGHVAPHLYRLLHTLARPVKVIIADGDAVEQKNLVRQNFISTDLGRNKARVLAERYSSAFGMEAHYVPEFIENEERLIDLVSSDGYSTGPYSFQHGLSILIGAVDNNKSRRLCHWVFKKTDNIIYIDSGNGEHNGQVVCGIRRNGRTYYKPVGEAYPDVLLDTDRFPTELSCAETAASAPQSIVANIMAATAIISYLYNILAIGSIETRSVTFSTKTLTLKPIIPQKRKKEARSMSIKTQKANMRTIYSLVSQDLGYAYGNSESGPNGIKKQFHTKSAAFLRALGSELGFKEFKVRNNYAGIAVSGEITLMGMWDEGNGLYLEISQPITQRREFMYRHITHMKDYTGGRNRWLSCDVFENAEYEKLVETLLAVRDDPKEAILAA